MLGDGPVSKGRGFHLDQRSARGHGVALRIGLLRITVGTSNVPRTSGAPVGRHGPWLSVIRLAADAREQVAVSVNFSAMCWCEGSKAFLATDERR